MDPHIKRSAVLPSDKGNLGKEPAQKNMVAGGLWGAIIGEALREAFEYDADRQQEYAEAQQQNAQLLGNVGGDPTKGLIALTAGSTASAGAETAAGQRALGQAMLVGAVVTGVMTAGLIYKGITTMRDVSKMQKSIEDIKNEAENLQGASGADITIGREGMSEDTELTNAMSKVAKGDDVEGSEPSTEAQEAIKVDDQESLESARAAKKQRMEDKQKEQGDLHKELDRFSQGGQMLSQTASGAAQSAGQYGQAPHTAKSAADSATAETEKTVQQLASTTGSTYQQSAAEAARDAQETAKALAQIAQSQSA